MGGKTSAKSKNEWIAKAYDRINLTVPKGQKEIIQAHAEAMGKSVNGFINEAIEEKMERDNRATKTYIGRDAKATQLDYYFEGCEMERHQEEELKQITHILSVEEAKKYARNRRPKACGVEICYEIKCKNDLYEGGVKLINVTVEYNLLDENYMITVEDAIVEGFCRNKD